MKKYLLKKVFDRCPDALANQEGAMGYLIAWLLGVPATVLVIIYLIRG